MITGILIALGTTLLFFVVLHKFIIYVNTGQYIAMKKQESLRELKK